MSYRQTDGQTDIIRSYVGILDMHAEQASMCREGREGMGWGGEGRGLKLGSDLRKQNVIKNVIMLTK